MSTGPDQPQAEPLRAVARGTAIALKNVDNFAFLMRE